MAATKEHAEDFRQRLDSEMLRWQAASKAAQDAHAEAHAAALSTHKDSRELALADADKWQTRYVELKREHDAALLASAEAMGQAEAAKAQLQADTRLAAFEAERLRQQTESALVSARQARVDADASDEKLKLLHSEFYALKTASATKIATLEAAQSSLSERLTVYESLEEELDKTVLQSGALESAHEASASASPSSSSALQPYLRVPSSSQRRMQQCLTLARDLLTCQRRAESAEAALLGAKGEAARFEGIANELQRKLRTTSQPHAYLTEQMELAEGRKLEAEAKVTNLKRQLTELSDALAASRAQNEQLLHDLESLLSQRGSLDALRSTLTRLLPTELGSAIAA